jgi:hypothetical protein
MRLRLGLLQDAATIEKQIARETAEADARRKRAAIPTVKTEAQAKREEDLTIKEKKAIQDSAKALPRIRPLSEAKAIETGANFISEAFLFCVAGGIIILEYWRSRRKESNRREDLFERLDQLEKERDDLKSKVEQIETVLETTEMPKVPQRMPPPAKQSPATPAPKEVNSNSVDGIPQKPKKQHSEGGFSKEVPDEAKQTKP